METIVRKVDDLESADRSALERVVGHPLGRGQRLVIQVVSPDQPAAAVPPSPGLPDLPAWTDVYAGLTDAEIDDLDAAIRERANLSRPAGPA